ncbi:MAG: DUF2862 domain-containing protein [Synechococcales cyanobacterium RU_4_20]|nr:DUF2862 domain-containing protein [Synechococcales cyanobacterium RU_4_20]NJR70778.1 DUF2862 domain-containing protein [Synechococcales cyanobacterium CRU_2_2]
MDIGQKVRVLRIRDRVPASVVNKLKQNPIGIVQGYRVVDGMGIGYIVKFDDAFSSWFFEDEIKLEA